MRSIGHLNSEAGARRFSDYLTGQGFRNQVELENDGTWTVWIHSEEQLGTARGLLEEFRAQPDAARFRDASAAAREVKRREEEDLKKFQGRFKSAEGIFRRFHFGPLTVGLMTLSVAVALLSRFGEDLDFLAPWFISEHLGTRLPEVREGQVWRLFSPIFIHFGPVHLLFNMLWLKDLGSMIESRLDSKRLFALVVVIAALSNFGQYQRTGPLFGGMSGVVYGLFGYIWIRGYFQPECGLYIDRYNVILMIVWFFLCLDGRIVRAANTAHGVGLGVGMVWGFLASRF